MEPVKSSRQTIQRLVLFFDFRRIFVCVECITHFMDMYLKSRNL